MIDKQTNTLPTVNEASGQQAAQIDLGAVVNALRFRKKLILTFVGIGCAVAAAIAVAKAPTYSSSALLQVKQSHGDLAQMASSVGDLLGMAGVGVMQKASSADVETVLLQSRYLLGKVVNQLHLDVVATPRYVPILGKISNHFFKGGKGFASPWFGLSQFAWGGESIAVGSFSAPYAYYDRDLYLVTQKNHHYQLMTSSQQPILQGVVGQLAKKGPFSLLVDQLHARPGTEFLLRKESLQMVLSGIQRRVQVTQQGDKNSSGIISIDYTSDSSSGVVKFLNALLDTAYKEGNLEKQRQAKKVLGFLNGQLPTIRGQLLKAEQQLSVYESKTGNFDISQQYKLLLQQILQSEQNLEQLKLKRTELLQKYTPQHPFVLTLNSKIADINNQIALYQQKLRYLPVSDEQAVEMTRNVKTQNQLYLLLLSKQQEMKIMQAGLDSNIRILNYAAEPPLINPPPRVAIVIVGGFIGFIIAILFILIRMMYSSKIMDSQYIENAFGLDVKAVVPYSKEQQKLLQMMKKSMAPQNDYLLARKHADDLAIEALRSLRTSLQVQLMSAKNNIICVTGLFPGVGKSFISINLAVILADLQKRVLFVEADLRRGISYKSFGCSKAPGLSNFSVSDQEVKLASLVQKTKSGVDYLGPGDARHNTSDLLANENLKQQLLDLSKDYDFVVIDTPPILLLTDAVLLSKLSGVNLLVLASGQHSGRELRDGLRVMARNDIACDGVVLNFKLRSAMRQAEQYYGYYRYNSYGGYKYDNKGD